MNTGRLPRHHTQARPWRYFSAWVALSLLTAASAWGLGRSERPSVVAGSSSITTTAADTSGTADTAVTRTSRNWAGGDVAGGAAGGIGERTDLPPISRTTPDLFRTTPTLDDAVVSGIIGRSPAAIINLQMQAGQSLRDLTIDVAPALQVAGIGDIIHMRLTVENHGTDTLQPGEAVVEFTTNAGLMILSETHTAGLEDLPNTVDGPSRWALVAGFNPGDIQYVDVVCKLTERPATEFKSTAEVVCTGDAYYRNNVMLGVVQPSQPNGNPDNPPGYRVHDDTSGIGSVGVSGMELLHDPVDSLVRDPDDVRGDSRTESPVDTPSPDGREVTGPKISMHSRRADRTPALASIAGNTPGVEPCASYPRKFDWGSTSKIC